MKKASCILLIFLASCNTRHDEAKLKDPQLIDLLKVNDRPLSTPKPGEWLYQYYEPGQTFNEYVKTDPARPSKGQNIIYLQPIGFFSNEQKKIVEYTAEYLQLFFSLKTIVLHPLADSIIPAGAKRKHNDNEQLLTSYINNNLLAKIKPADGFVIMAITSKDLYPQDSWNYVFGEASYEKRVGVSSLFRYSNNLLDSGNFKIGLSRFIQTSSHEIGHMFSLNHCTHAFCVMNGSNSLAESDTQPNRLCSECLQKLYWNIHFDIRDRLSALRDYFKKYRLQKDFDLMQKDISTIAN